MIELKNVTKKYDSKTVLDRIDLKLSDTGIVGLLGPNGAGKSTLMRILVGLSNMDEGERRTALAKTDIGYMSELNPMYEEMTAKEFLKFMANVRKVAESRIDELLNALEISQDFASKQIKKLSKGYKQRVGLIGALLHEPALLVLDEPSSGLDPEQLQVIRSFLKAYSKDHLILISSHILGEVEAVCEEVIFIKEGKLLKRVALEAMHDDSGLDFECEFDFAVEEQFLRRIKGVQQVEGLGAGVYRIRFDLNTDQPMRLLMDFADEQQLILKRFDQKKPGLEELFLELMR